MFFIITRALHLKNQGKESNTCHIQGQCFGRHNLLPPWLIISIFLHTEPTAAPTDVKATSVSVSEILVAWKHIKESLGRPQGFEV